MMQDRKSLNESKESAVEVLDPLTINENLVSRRKIKALIASHPDIHYFEALQSYEFVLDNKDAAVKLLKPLKLELQLTYVDLNALGSLSIEENAKFATFIQHLKHYSINTKERLFLHKDVVGDYENHLFAFEDESKTVIFRQVRLSHQLVVYPRKKDPADRRFAVLGHKIVAGGYGSIFSSARSISCSPNTNASAIVKDKNPDKRRVVKIQKDKWSNSFQALIADHEFTMTLKLAPELAVKPLAKHAERKFSAMVMRHIPGKDLFELITMGEIQSDIERLEICLAAAEALKVVHDRGGIHRDVKPDNFMLVKGEDGRCRLKLIDYGLAILQSVENKNITGSLTYIAPELFCGRSATVASDVYSLCRLFENIFGYYPSWDDVDDRVAMQNCFDNADKPFDRAVFKLDKVKRNLLDSLGLSELLNGMRTESVYNRMKLDEVIERLKSLITAFKAANESQPISSAVAAASAAPDLNQESESATHNGPSLRP